MSEEEQDKEFETHLADPLTNINENIVHTMNRLLANHKTELAEEFLSSIESDIILQRRRIEEFRERERLGRIK